MNFVWWDTSYWIVFLAWLVNVPQALRIIKKKDARQVAVLTYIGLLCVVVSYFIHALRLFYHVGDWVFIISNGLSIIITLWVLWLIKRYTPNFTYLGFFRSKIKKIKNAFF